MVLMALKYRPGEIQGRGCTEIAVSAGELSGHICRNNLVLVQGFFSGETFCVVLFSQGRLMPVNIMKPYV